MSKNPKTTSHSRGTTPAINQQARELRRTPIPTEKLLWSRLHKRQLNGWKFRRQHPLSKAIADFCCPADKLIIELDRSIHLTQFERDLARA